MTPRVALSGFVASSAIALATPLGLGSDKVQLVGMITRKFPTFNADCRDLMPLVEPRGLPVLFVEQAGDVATQAAWSRSRQPNLVMSIGWPRPLGLELLGVAPLGMIGHHPASLPANGERHSLIWAVTLDLEGTALSSFLMEPGTDASALTDQQRITIDSKNDVATAPTKDFAIRASAKSTSTRPSRRPNPASDMPRWPRTQNASSTSANISKRTIEVMKLYAGKMASALFLISARAIRPVAGFWGLAASCLAAETFIVVGDIE